jgi:NTP pyrophosphatase (non-canonical NTP hydrolase)
MIDLKIVAREAYECAFRRKKTSPGINHNIDVSSLAEEVAELYRASETAPSVHLPGYTETQEELTDILIGCLTELYKRGTDIEAILGDKMKFNEERK